MTDSPTADPDGGLVADAGPMFDPEADGAAPAPEADPDALLSGLSWSESRVKAMLSGQGALVHGAIAVEKGQSTEWLYTQADLAAIAPALTRILNRYPATRAAAASGDELAVVLGFAGYGVRSWSERREALQRLGAAIAQATPDTWEEPEPEPEPEPGPSFLPPIRSPRRR